jgi:hypothetical protein
VYRRIPESTGLRVQLCNVCRRQFFVHPDTVCTHYLPDNAFQMGPLYSNCLPFLPAAAVAVAVVLLVIRFHPRMDPSSHL